MTGFGSRTNSLTIVIPALNEEDAIGGTIERCLAAREQIKRESGLDEIELIVVSDGSTDRTVEIAQGYGEVSKVIVFPLNKGYGAAIKEGFRQGSGDLVGFIDADGTCDPRYFGAMCRATIEDDAEVALGSRMGPNSKMPKIRRLGNRLYAILLGFLCGRSVTDTASGMRVIRRSSLRHLYPLPDRLHFTPAMSARALVNGMRVVEIPMDYEERIGESKLRVLTDGVRFLRSILDGVLCFRPERLFLLGFSVCLLISALLAMYPVEYYAGHHRVEEWMIYRFVTCFFLGAVGFLLICAASLSHEMARLGPRRREGESFWTVIASRGFEGMTFWVLTGATTLGALALLWPGMIELFLTGRITLHWSRLMVGTFGLLLATQAIVTKVLTRVVAIWISQRAEQERYEIEEASRATNLLLARSVSVELNGSARRA